MVRFFYRDMIRKLKMISKYVWRIHFNCLKDASDQYPRVSTLYVTGTSKNYTHYSFWLDTVVLLYAPHSRKSAGVCKKQYA